MTEGFKSHVTSRERLVIIQNGSDQRGFYA